MLEAGVVEPVDCSEWASPLVVVPKADGGLRICADYKVSLNKVLLVDKYPVPKIDDIFSRLNGSVYFTKLDLSQAYNQILLDDDSQMLTVINTHRGLLKYKRLVYGLASSPGIFQRLMVNLLKDIKNVVVFFDDILCTGTTFEEHLQAVHEVLSRLKKHGLKIKIQKCEFFADKVKYLGFIIDKNGISADPEKVKAILEMQHPKNVSDLRSFLGMVNFYGKFVNGLSTILAPMHRLLKKDAVWQWGTQQMNAFEMVKKILSRTPVLAHYDAARPLLLTCDASSYGLGAVLAQRGAGGEERVIAYASRSLTSSECNYSQIHKEALAIIFAVKKFHQYLYGREFTLRTDHKPLVSMFGASTGVPSMTASRLQRWALILSAYTFSIEYVRSDKNMADAISRLIMAHHDNARNSAHERDEPEFTYLHFASEALLLDNNVLRRETKRDQILSQVLNYIRVGWPNEVEIRELKPFFNRRNELYSELDCVMWGHRIVVPHSCRDRVLMELHESHMGIVKTKSIARSYVWWPGLDEAIEQLCRACVVCAQTASAPPHHAPQPWPSTSKPWTRLHIDFLGPINGLTYLILVDSTSKWIEATNMTNTSAASVIKWLREIWARFGIPKQLVSDNGPPFTSVELKTFLENNHVEHIFSAPYHPASNGAAESAVKICKNVLRKAILQKVDIEVALCRFLLTYRNTAHNTTGDSPSKILQGRDLRTTLDRLKPEREVGVRQRQQERAAGGVTRSFSVGEEVWARNYGKGNKWLGGLVEQRTGRTDYVIKLLLNGNYIHRHIDQLRRRHSTIHTTNSAPIPVNHPTLVNQPSAVVSPLCYPTIPVEEAGPAGAAAVVAGAPQGGAGDAGATSAPVEQPAGSDENLSPESPNRYPIRNRHPPNRLGYF
ncbi:hypothetical protein JYU34_018592 [Plutella xylostella]|uniref:RNA-directed DNA polymerase n=1 Tax=Plutella xylostella TaxID=51655 RepID=A0ABQ7PY72_PLUXY|nr:hypothetical protein JYU34_018592 [Plutella xylostella]